MKVCSVIFLVVQVGLVISAIIFGKNTLPEGCEIFNTAKICAMVTLGVGLVYSLAILITRFKMLPIT